MACTGVYTTLSRRVIRSDPHSDVHRRCQFYKGREASLHRPSPKGRPSFSPGEASRSPLTQPVGRATAPTQRRGTVGPLGAAPRDVPDSPPSPLGLEPRTQSRMRFPLGSPSDLARQQLEGSGKLRVRHRLSRVWDLLSEGTEEAVARRPASSRWG